MKTPNFTYFPPPPKKKQKKSQKMARVYTKKFLGQDLSAREKISFFSNKNIFCYEFI